MTIKEALIKIDEWFSCEDKWCKKRGCTDRFGRPINNIHRAKKCCLIGAIVILVPEYFRIKRLVIERLANAIGGNDDVDLMRFNDLDSTTFIDIKNALKKAIESEA